MADAKQNDKTKQNKTKQKENYEEQKIGNDNNIYVHDKSVD